MYKILFMLVCAVFIFTSAYPQTPDIQNNIDSVFGPQPTTTRRPSRGPGTIVTPEPIVGPTQASQALINNIQQCVCVPYYDCNPTNQTVIDNDVIDGYGIIDIRMDAPVCEHFLDVCCYADNLTVTTTTPVSNTAVTTPLPARALGCGIRNVNGIDFQLEGNFNNEANYGEFPWTVALIRISDNGCVCGGSLIHPRVILTGNHCVRSFVNDPKDLKIRAGEWDTQTTKERLPYQERIASRIFSHPNYRDRNLAYDVAIIELEDSFQLDQHINTICLPQTGYVSTSRNCFASGWGKDVFGQAGKFSVIQKKVELPIVPYNECQSALQRTKLTSKFHLDTSFICAGGVPGVDTCQGDGGAPLACPVGNPSQNRYIQSGIVAWGIGCKEDHPAVYANVAMAREWIDSQVRSIGLNTSYYTY